MDTHQNNNMEIESSQLPLPASTTTTDMVPSTHGNIHGSAAVQTAVSASAPSVAGLGVSEPAAKVQKLALKTLSAKAKAKFESEDKLAMTIQRVAALETAYEQLVEKVAAGSKITGQLDVFAAQLAADKITVEAYLQSQGDKHRQELGALDALFQAKLAALEASLQAKLGMVEGAFGHCGKALSELQQQSYAATAASSSGHVPTDGPSIGPIRARLDEWPVLT